MIRKSGYRFSLATNAERVCAEIMHKQKARTGVRRGVLKVGRNQEGRPGMGHIDPTKEVFAQFRANDRPGPIHMLNLVRLRKQAAYPDGRQASGAEAYAAYGRGRGAVFTGRGGRVVQTWQVEIRFIG